MPININLDDNEEKEFLKTLAILVSINQNLERIANAIERTNRVCEYYCDYKGH